MEEVKQAITIKKEKQEATNKHELPVTVWKSLHETPPLHETAPPPVKVESLGIISKVEEEADSDISEAITIKQEEQEVTNKDGQHELPVTVWNSLHETTPLHETAPPLVNLINSKVKEEADSDISEAITIKQEEQEVTNKDGQHELPVTVWNSLHETTPLHETAPPLVNHINSKVKEEADSDISEAITIKQEEQEVNIKEEQQDFPVTAWSALHENPPPPVKVESSGIFINIKMEDKSDSSEMDDIQTVSSAVQESVKASLTKMKEDDSISLTLKSKPSDISELCMARERSVETQGRNPAEIEVCLDFEDLSSSKQDMLSSQFSFEASAVTSKVLGHDNAEHLQEKKGTGTSEMSLSNRRIFALSVLRDQCLKVITLWYMGQPFSKIVHNMNLNPDSVRHILHVWRTEKRLACHKPCHSKMKGKVRSRKGQVPTLWKWRFLVAVGKNSTLQCMVCDKRLNSAKMDNIACHIRNWHPYSAELPHHVRREIHQAWKRRQGLHTLQELQAKCTEKREMTSLPNEQDKMTSLSLSMQQSALQKLEHYSHVQEKKNTINDSRLCNQTKDYTIHHVADNDEKRESNTHQTCNIQSNVNNIQKTPSKKQRQTRYFQDQWRQKYLVDYDWKAEEVVCLVCGLRMRCLRSCTFERHAQRRHPESILYSKETRNALWESWNKGQHSFPLLNAASGMSDFKVCSNRMESQTGFIKHCDPGLQEWQEDCKEELEIKRLQAMQDKLIPIVQHNDRLPVQQKAQKCLYAQQQQSTINESRVNNQTEYSTIQCSTHLKQPDSQHIWNTHRKKDMPQLVLKKQKQMRNFQEHWRQKYLVDYDWKTEQAVCILCGLRMRSLRSCTLERHAQRRHPESVHYPEKTRNALLKTWNKEEHIYPLCHAGSTISDTNMCQEEMKSQPNWQENHEPSMNAEDYMAIQQEQIESVLKSTNSQHEVYS